MHTFGDAHIYLDHIEQINEQISREPMPLGRIELNKEITDIEDFTYEDIKVVDYQSHPAIKGKVSV